MDSPPMRWGLNEQLQRQNEKFEKLKQKADELNLIFEDRQWLRERIGWLINEFAHGAFPILNQVIIQTEPRVPTVDGTSGYVLRRILRELINDVFVEIGHSSPLPTTSSSLSTLSPDLLGGILKISTENSSLHNKLAASLQANAQLSLQNARLHEQLAYISNPVTPSQNPRRFGGETPLLLVDHCRGGLLPRLDSTLSNVTMAVGLSPSKLELPEWNDDDCSPSGILDIVRRSFDHDSIMRRWLDDMENVETPIYEQKDPHRIEAGPTVLGILLELQKARSTGKLPWEDEGDYLNIKDDLEEYCAVLVGGGS